MEQSILRSEMSVEAASDMSLGLDQLRSEMSVDDLDVSEGPSKDLEVTESPSQGLESPNIDQSITPEVNKEILSAKSSPTTICSELPSNYLPSNDDIVKYYKFKKLSKKSNGK